MYYKNKENQPYYEPSQAIIQRDGLVEITEAKFNKIVVEINTPTPEQILAQQIAEAKQYLEKTDHKFYNAYKPKEGEDLVEIERLRDEAREFIRANENDI